MKINSNQTYYYDKKIKLLLNELPVQEELTLIFQAEDKTGNFSEVKKINFIIDDTPPESTISIK